MKEGMSMKNGNCYFVKRKSDGKKVCVNSTAYFKIAMSRVTLDLSVDHLEEDLEEGKVVERTKNFSSYVV